MLFKRFYDDNLAQASYLIACERTREAIVVDPNLDIAQYTRAAGAERVRIAHVIETHIHADFVSGALALAAAAGAKLHLSAEGGKDWGYTGDTLERGHPLHDGSEITLGSVRVLASHTPGHTPEHLTFFVSDLERGPDPVGAVTGDFVFVGDVGRPDLLERAVGARGSMESSAAELYRSIRKFKQQPDHLQIWPGHGAGSACGKSLGSMPQSTLGYERLFNWAFSDMSEREFVLRVLKDQPVPPRYFAAMKKTNRRPQSVPIPPPPPRELPLDDLERALKEGAAVIDTRAADKFAAGHIPGTFNIPRSKSFLNWSGALVAENSAVYLITDGDTDDEVKLLVSELAKIGITGAPGYFGPQIFSEWTSARGKLEKVTQLDAPQLRQLTGDERVQVIDVRGPEEWRHGHLPRAIHIPLAALPDRVNELDSSVPIVLHCKGGGRSSIATSFLQARGMANVSNLAGGYEGWVKSGFEVQDDEPATDAAARKA
ncbi:MAG: rhodanese-like domain-containing protein [Gemmatimonadota bacterium]|nr:rhodanese-like domain-containing protein [Gemmatimonadota bacterium]